MKVSVIIPNYNGIKHLKVCLDSLRGQTFKHFETIVVDNGSTDGSLELLTEQYPEVRLIGLDRNYGFSRAVNEGIKASQAEYIVLLNNDTEAHHGWLASLVKCIDGDERIFSCSSKMISYSDRNKIDDAGDGYTILGWGRKWGEGRGIEQFTVDREIFSSCGGASIYRRSIFDEIGLFDESFFAYMEDVDIGYRARIAGYKNMYCAGAHIYHIGSATSGSKYNSFKVRLAARNNIYLAYKNMPFLQLLLNSPFLLLGFAAKAAYFCKKGFGKDYIHGMGEALRSVKTIKKTKYYGKNFINYVKIELDLIFNTIKMFS